MHQNYCRPSPAACANQAPSPWNGLAFATTSPVARPHRLVARGCSRSIRALTRTGSLNNSNAPRKSAPCSTAAAASSSAASSTPQRSSTKHALKARPSNPLRSSISSRSPSALPRGVISSIHHRMRRGMNGQALPSSHRLYSITNSLRFCVSCAERSNPMGVSTMTPLLNSAAFAGQWNVSIAPSKRVSVDPSAA